ncbi:MAG: hypothetical protein ACOC2N_00655 [Spirochaetota bacterium]
MENALWGLFIGDALAMPAHWYYDRENIRRDFDGGVTGYEAPEHPHPESFMVGMEYRPDVECARASGRPYDILHDLAGGAEPQAALEAQAQEIHLPVVTGDRLLAAYRDHHGPGNIPDEQMWKLHTDLRSAAFDLRETAKTVPEDEAVMGISATACYPEHGLPLSLFLAARHESAVRPTLLANANAGATASTEAWSSVCSSAPRRTSSRVSSSPD